MIKKNNENTIISDKKIDNETLSKFLCDYLPLIVFILIYKLSNAANPLLPATLWLLVTSFVALIISYFLTKKIAKMPLISAAILGIFGGLTLLSGDEIFIKIKPTLINLIFAAILFYGYFSGRPLIKYLFADNIKIQDKAWLILSLRWALFFLFLAFLNEIIWRNFSTDFWVNFKVFGVFPLSMIFTLSQIPFMIKQIKLYRS